MRCLEIPVDHRLVKFIDVLIFPSFNDESSHLDILETFGRTAKRNGEPISSAEFHHGLELAGPGTKGGVLVALLRPPRNQTFDKGFTADLCSCRTTHAFQELVTTASGGKMTADDISAFDTLPYSPEGSDEYDLIKRAEQTFSDMVKAKKPEVVLCCYQGDSADKFIGGLRSLGVGQVFDDPCLQISADCTITRVNAFHPSYAVNYQPTYSCFRRLLLLEFVKVFSHWTGKWKEEAWMDKLRSDCATLARKLSSTKITLPPLCCITDQTSGKPKIAWHSTSKDRWASILEAIRLSLSKLDFFRFDADEDHFRERLIESDLTWNCADAFLFLDMNAKANGNSDIARMLLSSFDGWCKLACEPAKPRKNYNQSDLRGYFDLQCFSTKPKVSKPFMRELHRLFFSFLKDINLSFNRNNSDIHNIQYDISAQRDAFRRFSTNSEKVAGKISSLSDEFQNLGIN
jgi:hypothetical protein